MRLFLRRIPLLMILFTASSFAADRPGSLVHKGRSAVCAERHGGDEQPFGDRGGDSGFCKTAATP